MAVLGATGELGVLKQKGKVAALEELQQQSPLAGFTGIAHTRWATHGEPSQVNAHPHLSRNDIALVHNRIIENFAELKLQLEKSGYRCSSATESLNAVATVTMSAWVCSVVMKAGRPP